MSSSNSNTTNWNPEAEGWVPRVHHPPQQPVALPIPTSTPSPYSAAVPNPNATRFFNPVGPCQRRAFEYFPQLKREESGSRTFDADPEIRHIWTSGQVNKKTFTFTFFYLLFCLCVVCRLFLVLSLHLTGGRVFTRHHCESEGKASS